MVSMGMFSLEWWLLLGVFVVFAICIARLRRVKSPDEPQPVRDLDDSTVRYQLTRFLHNHRIKGDADIRNGQCVSIENPDLGLSTALSAMFMQTYNEIAATPNMQNGMLYYRHVGDGFDSFKLAGGLTVGDLRQAAIAIEQHEKLMTAFKSPKNLNAVLGDSIAIQKAQADG